MIDVFYFSIAGKKSNKVVDSMLLTLKSADYISPQDKLLINHSLECSEKGQYPSKEYFLNFYKTPEFSYRKLAEIAVYFDKMCDFYQQQFIKGNVLSAINSSNSVAELVNNISDSISQREVSDSDLDKFDPVTYTDFDNRPHSEGLKTGINEIDSLTNGFQPGTIGCIAAYVGEGKSTTWDSILYKNARDGKKCVLLSVEMPPELVWMNIQARYLYEEKSMDITAQDLVFHKLTDEKKKEVASYDADFKKDICANLLIVDESILSKTIISDYRQMENLFEKFQKKLGCLDMVVWDHIGQIELMYPEMGNIAVRTITSATKIWLNNKKCKIFTGLAVQTNREGRKRAAKRDGLYDLRAISDLNEVERSSTYCIFLYTSDDSKIVQETKVSMLKHRLGSVLTEPAVITFNPAVCMVGSDIEDIQGTDGEFNSLEDNFTDDMF